MTTIGSRSGDCSGTTRFDWIAPRTYFQPVITPVHLEALKAYPGHWMRVAYADSSHRMMSHLDHTRELIGPKYEMIVESFLPPHPTPTMYGLYVRYIGPDD